MQFSYGEVWSKIPTEFTPPEMWPEYGSVADPAPLCRSELVHDTPAAVRWCLWPLCFEQHWGDDEPDVVAAARTGVLAYNRIVLWRRLREVPVLAGWHQALGGTFRVDGYQRLDGEDYIKRWNKNARRDLRLWQRQFLDNTHHIEKISHEEYAIAYKKSLISKREGVERLRDLERKLAVPIVREHTTLWGVRDTQTSEVVAGIAVIFSPTYKSSTHFAPFIHEEARRLYAATGLMHHWFEQSLRHGCPVVMTTNFWHPGKPKSWKGFSEFKSHFGFTYVAYPRLLWRFMLGKLF